jgi:hypothetical protein
MSFQKLWTRLSPIAWLFPVAVMAAGALFSPLRAFVGREIPPVAITPGLLVQVILLAAWLLAENHYAASRATRISQLQTDALLSILLALVFAFGAGYLLALGECPWFFLMPAVTAIADAFMTANQGLNSAAQRRLITHDIDPSL